VKTEVLIAERKVAEQALSASEQFNRSLIASTSDYVYTVVMDQGGAGATSHGQGCEAITGFTPHEFEADASLWCRMIHLEDRPAVLQQVSRILNGEAPRPLEHRIIHKDGTLRWVRNVAIPRRDGDGRLISYNGLISDITERKRAEQLLMMQYVVTRQLAEADTLPEALVRILRAVCETFAYEWGAVWTLDAKAKVLRWGGIWHESKAMELAPFRRESAALNFAPGVDLPGRVWASDQPAWITDAAEDKAFSRALVANRAGLHGACAFPIHQEGRLAGVIELLSHRVEPPDPKMIQMLTMVGTQIGQSIAQKSAEETLTTERNLLRTLIDSLPDYVFAKDTQSRFLLNNVAHVRVLGATRPQEVRGKTDREFFPPELASHYLADDEAVLQSGRALFNREEPVVDRAGNRQWVLTTKVPWKDSRGRVVGLIGVSRDITERKLLQEKDRLSEARLQAILDYSPAVIYLKDTEGRYLLVNRRFEALFHMKRAESIGKTDNDLFPPETAKAFQANDEKVIAGMTPLEIEEVAPHEDGPHTYISVKFPLVGETGIAYGVCGISTDISERKRAEQLLHRAYEELAQNEASLKRTVRELQVAHDELKATEMHLIQAAKMECIGTLAAGVAHEVKNPLQTMLMGLHYLEQNVPANKGTATALEYMREAVIRANRILSGLLELSAATPCEIKREDLNACVERSLWLLHYELLTTHTNVVRQLAIDLPLVPMDGPKMEQVLINLFVNALHAMSEGGTLTVSTRMFSWSGDLASREPMFRQFKAGDALATVEVQDTGTGIPEDLLPKVFDPFFTTKPAGHGTGLGLAVVKKIVELHGGAIAIRNIPPRGARVTLILKLE
jgi:PAS domain S-box-containing protein